MIRIEGIAPVRLVGDVAEGVGEMAAIRHFHRCEGDVGVVITKYKALPNTNH